MRNTAVPKVTSQGVELDTSARSFRPLAAAGSGAQPLFPLVITWAFVSVTPIIVSFPFLQRYWWGGLTFGSLKD